MAAAIAAMLCFATAAMATAPPPLVKAPEDGIAGEGAGRMRFSLGIAADPNLPGHVFVADFPNARVEEFTPWGEFVKAWGWGVVSGTTEPNELQTCTAAPPGCQKGKEGVGNGEFKEPEAITVDGAGNVYVIEASNHRVQKFDPSGGVGEKEAVFLGKFGEAGTGSGQFGGGELDYRNKLAACPANNSIYVGEGKRIQRFDSAGVFKGEIKLSEIVGPLAADSDSACNLYLASQGKAQVKKIEGGSVEGSVAEKVLNTPTFEKPENEAESTKSLAVDGDGYVYASIRPAGGEPARVQKYDGKSGKCLTCGKDGEGSKGGFDRSSETQLESVAATSACEADDAYVLHFKAFPELAFLSAFGEPPKNTAFCPRPEVAPEIDAQYALAVESDSAEIQAEINPRFWNSTVFHVEYGTSECSTGGCTTTTAPLKLTNQTISAPLRTPGIFLEGLAPGTTYYYRFVASTCFEEVEPGKCAPGKEVEVKGVGGKVGVDGAESTFTTYRLPLIEECPANRALRIGASEALPDCRAYEMVSPIDKEGADIRALQQLTTALPAVLSQSSTSGDRVAYGSYRSFGGATSAPFTTEYVASRDAGVGWATHAVVAPREQVLVIKVGGFDTEFRLFSPDLCNAWFGTYAEPALAAGAPAGYPDLYRRSDEECGGPDYEALNTLTPLHIKPGPPVPEPKEEGASPTLAPELLGLSADGTASVFAANDLAPVGSEKQFQLYAAKGGEERFLCILPGGGGAPWTESCTAGGSSAGDASAENRSTNVAGAISADGSKVYWTASKGNAAPIYLRENPFAEGPECVEESSPCTIPVSRTAEEEAGTSASEYWAAAKDGSRALFVTGGRLYEFVLSEPNSPHLIARQVVGTLGASEDASRVYLVSKEAIVAPAVSGRDNLYFYEGGQFQFIGALGSEDFSNGLISSIAPVPFRHTSRVAPDGLSAAFMSTTQLTGYDNADQASGQADAEVFLYDAGAAKLVCASCNPGGARPRGEEFILPGLPSGPWIAARIPVFENNLYASRVLSDNGKRLYFDSQDPLVSGDSNGTEDVYQWEAAGAGTCKLTSPTYSPPNGGCVDLISSGQSKLDSEFLDASPSGNDVFFSTLSGLVSHDPGLIDVYDARANGGLPSPPAAKIECEGETCQPPIAAPPAPTPPSAAYVGPGNLPPEKSKAPKCPKGKHKVTKKNGKSGCAKNKQKKSAKRKRAAKGGRASR